MPFDQSGIYYTQASRVSQINALNSQLAQAQFTGDADTRDARVAQIQAQLNQLGGGAISGDNPQQDEKDHAYAWQNAQANTPEWQAAMAAYNSGQAVPKQYQGFIDHVGVPPGQLTQQRTGLSLQQWTKDDQESGVGKFADVAIPALMATMIGAGVGGGAAGAGNTSLPAGGMTATGTTSAADASLMGVGAGEGTGGVLAGNLALPAGGMTATGTATGLADAAAVGTGLGGTLLGNTPTDGGGNLLSSVLGAKGQNIAPLLGLGTSLLNSSNAGGTATAAAAAADPFASQRGQYQTMLSTLMNDPNSFMTSPLFQADLSAGVGAVNTSAAAKGQLNSGNRLIDLMDYGSGAAFKDYTSYANLLGTLSGATTSNPAAAGQAISQGGANQTAATNQLGSSLSTLATNYYNAPTKPSSSSSLTEHI